MAKIGFVGLGHMGLPMAINLVKSGHIVTGYDLQAKSIHDLCENGGNQAASLAELSHDKDFIITMLQNGGQVIKVCDGDSGLFANASPGTTFIDCSTIDVPSSKNFHHLANKYNFMSIDAPVSGGVAGAKSATLTFMVGGSLDAFRVAQPILTLMGKKIIHAGSAGCGQAAKICNNMLLGISMIASAEAFLLGEKLGLDASKLHEVFTNASGKCWVIDKYVPVPNVLEAVPANNNYQPGFTTAMMLKDLNLSQQSAKSVGLTTKLGELAQQIYQEALNNHQENLDFSAIILEKNI